MASPTKKTWTIRDRKTLQRRTRRNKLTNISGKQVQAIKTIKELAAGL